MDLARARLGRIDPSVLADLLKLTAEERAKLLSTLRQTPQAIRADGTVPVEVGLTISTTIRSKGSAING